MDSFLRYVEETRDCEQNSLDIAVNRGIRMAGNDRFDARKLIKLAAACVFSFVMFIAVNSEPIRMAVDVYYLNWNKTMSGNIEILDDYLVEKTSNIKKHLGGK